METSILVHNIAGYFAGKHLNYLAKMAMGVGMSNEYFKGNWVSEYKSRVKQMTDKPGLIEVLNVEAKQQGETKLKFYYEKHI